MVRPSGAVRVAEQPTIAPDHTDGVDTVPVPVAHHRYVPRDPIPDDQFRVSGPLDLPDVPDQLVGAGDTMSGVAHHRCGPDPRVGEVSHERDVPCGAEFEGLIGASTAQRVAQLPCGSGYHRDPRRVRALGSGVGEEPGSVVGVGGLGHGAGGGAGRVPFPRCHAGDDPTADGAEAREVPVALPVAETGAAHLPLVAIVVVALAVAVDTGVTTGPRPTTTAAPAAGRVAVHVIAALAVAVGVPLRPPPACDHVPRRTGVDPVDVGAEVGPSVVAGGAGATVTGDDGGVGAAGTEEVGGGCGHQGGADHRRPTEKASSRGMAVE